MENIRNDKKRKFEIKNNLIQELKRYKKLEEKYKSSNDEIDRKINDVIKTNMYISEKLNSFIDIINKEANVFEKYLTIKNEHNQMKDKLINSHNTIMDFLINTNDNESDSDYDSDTTIKEKETEKKQKTFHIYKENTASYNIIKLFKDEGNNWLTRNQIIAKLPDVKNIQPRLSTLRIKNIIIRKCDGVSEHKNINVYRFKLTEDYFNFINNTYNTPPSP
jgi:transcription antitermination factor NusG